MKKIIRYITAVILFLTGLTGCQDNENWTIVTDVQPGTYITGTATSFSAVAPAAALTAAPVDGDATATPGMIGIFTWLRASGDFTIVKADDKGNTTSYGKGADVTSSTHGTTMLDPSGSPYKVAEDGLYYVVLNSKENQLTVLPVKWGVIGDATPEAWNAETPLPNISFNETSFAVEFKGEVLLSKAQIKFRYGGDWGVTLPYSADGSTTVRIHTNLGASGDVGDGDVKLSAASVELAAGGKNLGVDKNGSYVITLRFELPSLLYKASMVLGDGPQPEPEPEFPEKLYMVGDAYKGWPDNNWGEVAGELVPVNGTPGHFWKIAWLKPGGFKFAPGLEWKNDFGIAEDNTNAIGEYTKGTKNINVATEGYYQIYVNMPDEKIIITTQKVILKGDAATGGWDSSSTTDAFVPDATNAKQLVSPAFAKDAELRICVELPNIDWWKAEFIVLEGKIEYRGNGGDQTRVPVTAGGKVTLNFEAGTGVIE